MPAGFDWKEVPEDYDVLAPDGSEIRLLVSVNGASMVHCRLPVGGVSRAVRHRSVEEVWYFIAGQGQVWRKIGEAEMVVEVGPGASLSIPLGASFQFCNAGDEPLDFVITTIPPWPGEEQAERVEDYWETK